MPGGLVEESVPIISFLGPRSSYTHQVLSFEILHPGYLGSRSIGLTDHDIVQAALQTYGSEAGRYDYRPATTIQGTSKPSRKPD